MGRLKEPRWRCWRRDRCLDDRLLRLRWALFFARSTAPPCVAGLSSNRTRSCTLVSIVPPILPDIFALLPSSSRSTLSTATFESSFLNCMNMKPPCDKSRAFNPLLLHMKFLGSWGQTIKWKMDSSLAKDRLHSSHIRVQTLNSHLVQTPTPHHQKFNTKDTNCIPVTEIQGDHWTLMGKAWHNSNHLDQSLQKTVMFWIKSHTNEQSRMSL